ncbi:DMSO/TMAO reductase YedYZ molybdopterin-dependent catalytic subunit [Paenibacillus taihuensis]|uniref:DMSO/TMAO reductase YedYZ molybdopterin-dependent catalytic subunit n=1 Tax=Paenibacillus taihuensis TaxID=1156355 RepID=A0A3D9QWK6_9BACL|nr:sulfite oxidase-like oxidoreductase [Paenibacillus taihuensis]REE70491.1 DMSO/TMAO reductase YedYZ molybdopterin-dependent catalytic subunit [Paenibacillus taihuensis]
MHNKAERLKNARVVEVDPNLDPELARRLPPGQALTERFPILHEGEVPQYDLDAWTFRVFGEVEKELTFSLEQLKAMKQTDVVIDIHCVTRWSKFDTRWEGILFKDLLPLLGVKPEARYVMVHADNGYETNVPLEDLMGDEVMLAFEFDGKPLTPKHGFPVRLVVPHLYFWKSAKWVRGFEFMKEDRLGFWERNGFHNVADPFREERFSGEDLGLPEDLWVDVDFD